MKFSYDAKITQKFKNKGTLITILTLIMIFVFGILFNNWSSSLNYLEVKELESNPTPIIIFCVAICVFFICSIYPAIQALVTAQCLQTNFIEITTNKINGMVCSDLKNKDNIQYFSLDPEEIIKVEHAPSDSAYTVFIHTKNTTYKLCIENADLAVSHINNFISKKAKNQIWQCPKCAKEVCWGQLQCSCGQKFDWTKL